MARGFTLVEMLAVVTLLALTVSLVTASFAGSVDSGRLSEAESVVRNADAQARLRARTSGPVRLSVDRSVINLEREFGARDRISSNRVSITLPNHARVFMLSADGMETLELIRFDKLGRSPDYRVRIELGASLRTLRVAGLTGWIEENDP
jgi:prepilin-type N-terminal cleavage/methylation domain-containing protein